MTYRSVSSIGRARKYRRFSYSTLVERLHQFESRLLVQVSATWFKVLPDVSPIWVWMSMVYGREAQLLFMEMV